MAASAGFRQQCPSCEAMVSVKDISFVGKKIDCPKCKYRFVVEEPPVEEDDDLDAAPVRGGKAAARRGGAAVAAKRGKMRRDEDEDDRPGSKKKKGGPSTSLILGIGLGVVGVAVLVVVGLYIGGVFDDEKPSSSSSASSSSSSTSPRASNTQAAQPAAQVASYTGKDATNLLPNDCNVVLRMDLDKTLSSGIGDAAFKAPGSFSPAAFLEAFGFNLIDIDVALRAINMQEGWHFNVIRTNKTINKEDLLARLMLKQEAPIGGMDYYTVGADLDSFSNFMFQKEPRDRKQKPDPLALHFVDERTLVIGHVPAMKGFLEAKGQPKNQSQPQAAAGNQVAGAGMMGGPGMGMMGGPGMAGGPSGAGMMGGPGMGPGAGGPSGAGMMGGPGMGPGRPGGGAAGAAGGAGAAGAAPGGAGAAGAGAQGGAGAAGEAGGQRPGGKLGGAGAGEGGGGPGAGMMGGPGMGMMGGPGMGMMGGFGGNTRDNTPPSNSYLTIRPNMKAVMDAVEAGQTNLVSFVVDEEAERSGVQLSDSVLKLLPPISYHGSETSARAVAIQAFRPDRLTMAISVYLKDEAHAKSLTDRERNAQALGVALVLKGKYGIDAAVGNQQQGGGMGGPGMMGPGMMGPGMNMMGGPGMNMMGGPGMMGGGMMPGPGMNMMGGPGMNMMGGPGMGPGAQPPAAQGGGQADEPGAGGGGARAGGQGGRNQRGTQNQAEQSRVWVSQKDMALTLHIDVHLTEANYDLVRSDLQTQLAVIKGEAQMIGAKQRVHDMAAALKALLKDRDGKFPQGAHERKPTADRGGIPYRPDERLSWMVEMLPYLPGAEYGELYDAIAKEKSWHDPTNEQLSTILVAPFVNPWSDRKAWWVPYPNLKKPVATTHFVGVAGLGLDAAEYRKDDKAVADKLGVFHYDWAPSLEDLKKPEYTIAILEVPYQDFKTPWIAGGGSTVRGVDEEAGVAPFVCESYKGKAGTYAIMANGDVRFVPRDVPKDVFLKMCSITLADKIDNLDEVCPIVPPPPAPVKKAPPAPPAAPLPPKAEAAKPAAAGTADAKVIAALTKNCGQCHTGARSKGKNVIFNDDGSLNPNLQKAEMAKAISEGKMPPKQRGPLSEEDRTTILSFLNGK